jgi:pimeloyl-ACP methyl ester carboxylesterase
VNLDTHRVIDLLPDRQAETATAWMQAHAEITHVSRDRGSEYASAASRGAPQAIQVADRFHVAKNLSEAVEATAGPRPHRAKSRFSGDRSGTSGPGREAITGRGMASYSRCAGQIGDLPGATELNLRLWVDGPQRTPEQVSPTVRQRVYEMQYHALTIPIPEGADEQDLQPPAITRLSEVRVPTLIIVGDLDLPEKLDLTNQLATSIRRARQEIIAGTAHMVNMEQPQEFNRIVLDFLSKV